jgi:hypothetical protein
LICAIPTVAVAPFFGGGEEEEEEEEERAADHTMTEHVTMGTEPGSSENKTRKQFSFLSSSVEGGGTVGGMMGPSSRTDLQFTHVA